METWPQMGAANFFLFVLLVASCTQFAIAEGPNEAGSRITSNKKQNATETSSQQSTQKVAGGNVLKNATTTADRAGSASNTSSTVLSKPASRPASSTEPKRVKEVQIVKSAPAAAVADENDIDTSGACGEAVKKLCPKVKPGNGSLAECLTENLLALNMLSTANLNAFGEDCREEVLQYKINQNMNINANPKLADACLEDATKYCNHSSKWQKGSVIKCLKEQKDKLSEQCQAEVFKVQQAGAMDFRADAQLYEACKAEADRLCKHAKPGDGSVQACLREKIHKLEWDCKNEVYRQAIENADDLRLNVQLFKKCLSAKRLFCPDVAPGNAHAINCLELHRLEESFPAECKEELDIMLQRRVEDFRLDPRLMRVCKEEVLDLCTAYDVDVMYEYSEVEANCLQDSIRLIQDEACRKMVSQYQTLAAEDVRFNLPLAVACAADRQQFCGSIPPGSAKVMRCLEKQRNKLSVLCRAELFDQEQIFSENIDFQYPLKKACGKEISTFCADVPHGEARVIRCLQDKRSKEKGKFTESCIKELGSYENFVSQDYRLNYRLKRACQGEVDKLCKGACNTTNGEVCGGRILHCLTENAGSITNAACKKEVFYFQKMEVNDYKNDVLLAEACKSDVEKFCNSVESGEGRIHTCLREHRDKLSPQCREEELGLEAQEAENIELRPRLLTACKDERDMFCSGVATGNGRVFRCLAEHMGDSDFGESCAVEILAKMSRRQASWKLDPSLRKACKTTVQDVCAMEDKKRGEAGEVLKCLVQNYDELPDEGCQREVSRALHMAFFIWQPGSILTKVCDGDVERLCLKTRPNMAKSTGAVLKCLSTVYKNTVEAAASEDRKQTTAEVTQQLPKLSDACSSFIHSAEPHSAREEFETSLLVASIATSLQNIGDRTGLKMVKYEINGEPLGFTLTGWTALLGVAAFSVLLGYAAWMLYRQYYHLPVDKDYTLVVKAAHTPSAAPSARRAGHR